MTKPDVEPCALCRQKPYTGLYGLVMCDDDDCPSAAEYVAPDVWNEFQRRITAELRKAFEAGVLNSTVFKLGDGELLPSELLTRLFDDYLAERKA